MREGFAEALDQGKEKRFKFAISIANFRIKPEPTQPLFSLPNV